MVKMAAALLLFVGGVCLLPQQLWAGATPPITYAKLLDTDSGPGGALRWKRCVLNCTCAHHDGPCPIAALEELCRSTPHCAGFNSHGWLKSCVAKGCGQTNEPSPGCDLYVGSATTSGGWPAPPPNPKPHMPPLGPAPAPWKPHAWPHSPPPTPPAPPTTPPAPVPPVEDWHFPEEERAELAAAGQLRIVSVDAASNSSGTIHLSVGSAPVESLGVGDTACSGWQLRSFIVGAGLGPPIAVLEHDWSRWGSLLFVQPSATAEEGLQQLGECELVAAPTSCFVARKGVGRTSALRRPRYALEAVDRDYFVKARDLPTDYLRERMCETTDGEPTFASAASLLPPSRDYAMVGNLAAHTKFSVSADGRVKSGNHSIYTPMEQADVTNGADGSELLWDPRNHIAWWPVYNFSEYKSAVVGRTSRAVTVSAWDTTARRGFALMATPNTRRGIQKGGDGAAYDPAEILLRLEDVSVAAAAGEQRDTPRYFAVQDCGMGKTSLCRTPQQRTLPDPAEFYAHLLHHTLGWNIFHGEVKPARRLGLGAAPMQLQLGGKNASGEGTRLVDMSRAVISAGMTMYLGMRPNYGDGSIYWSVTAHDAGSLPLITAALDRALLLWGHPLAAAARVEFYLNTYVRNSSGLTPENHAGMTRNPLYEKDGRGPPGSLDLKQWGCGHGPGGEVMPHNFQDSLADYGQLIELWVDLARAMEQEPGGAAWVERTWPQLQQLANFTLHLHDEAIDAKHPFPAEGLLVGPAEHDTCAYYGPFFSINAWTWRGWKMLRGFVLDTDAALPGADDAYAAMLGARIATLARAIEAAVSVSLVRKDRKAFFLPPYAVVNATPYSSMIERGEQGSSGASSYTNFRYWAEMLSSGFFSPEISHAISDFRETHTGTLSGMTRFLDHLDDMPAEGYAYSAMDLARVDSFQALLFGHAANYHSRGVFNAPEQMSLYGDGVKGLWTYSDSYRAYLKNGTTGPSDVDIDFCLPSTTLPATMVRWMMLFEERDCDVLALFRATPRRFFTPGDDAAIELAGGTTRYGTVDANVTVKPAAGLEECPETVTASILLRLHGRGFVSSANRTLNIEVRLRTHGACNGSRHLKSATVCVGGGNMTKFNCHSHAAFDVDKSSETVTVRLPVSVSRQSYRLTIDGHYASDSGSGHAVKTDDPLDAASAAASSNLQYCYINSAIACPKRGPVLPVASDTCCVNWYSPSGFGCGASVSAALVNASQGCGDGFPANTTAVCCKPGPSDPPSKTLPNVLVLGDSVSIHYTVQNADNLTSRLADVGKVQHAPYDLADGGALDTAWGVACLDNWLRTQHWAPVNWSVIVFNFGLHDRSNDSYCEGLYRAQLTEIATRLNATGAQLIYATTTPFMPQRLLNNTCIEDMNSIARKVVKPFGATVVDLYKKVTDVCGSVYTNCSICAATPCDFHYKEPGREMLATAVAGAIRKLLPKILDTSLPAFKTDDPLLLATVPAAVAKTRDPIVVSVDSARRTPPLYGWSSEITVTDVSDTQLAATTARTGASIARYPGGTPADYMDWRTDWHWPNMTWSPHDGPWFDVHPRPASPSAWRKWTQAASIPCTVIDVCQLCNNTEQCCTLELELAGLHEHARVGNDVTHVELGNEMYDSSRADVLRQYPQPKDYADKMLGWVKAIKREFPQVKVALVGMQADKATWPQQARPGVHASVPTCTRTNTSATCRQFNWNKEVLESEASRQADAATMHLYFSEYQNYNASQMLADPLSFDHFIGRAFTTAFDNAEHQAQAVPLHLRIWVTEAGLYGSDPTHRTWVDALTIVALDCLLALSNRTDLILMYGLSEGSDPAVVSPLYSCDKSGPCAPHSAAGKADFQVTPSGVAQGLLFAAAKRAASDTMSPLVFSHNPQLSPAENRSKSLVGFRFASEGGGEALILNLGNATINLDMRAVFPRATANVGGGGELHLTQLYAKTRADAVVAGLNATTLGHDKMRVHAGALICLRPFSVSSITSLANLQQALNDDVVSPPRSR